MIEPDFSAYSQSVVQSRAKLFGDGQEGSIPKEVIIDYRWLSKVGLTRVDIRP